MERLLMERFTEEGSVPIDNPVAILNLVQTCIAANQSAYEPDVVLLHGVVAYYVILWLVVMKTLLGITGPLLSIYEVGG